MLFSALLSHGLGPLGSLSSHFALRARESLSEQTQNGLEKYLSAMLGLFILPSIALI